MSNPARTHWLARYSRPAAGERSEEPSLITSVPEFTASRVTNDAASLRIRTSSVNVSCPDPGMMTPTSEMKKSPGVGFLMISEAIAYTAISTTTCSSLNVLPPAPAVRTMKAVMISPTATESVKAMLWALVVPAANVTVAEVTPFTRI